MLRLTIVCAVAALAGAVAADVHLRDDDYDSGSQRTRLGSWTIPVPLQVQAELGLDPGQGRLVVAVRPGGTADLLGIKPGDVLTSIDGRPISTRADIRAAVRAASAGDEIQVSVASPRGIADERSGTWQPRPPRGGPPPWAGMGMPPWGLPPGGMPGWGGPMDERNTRADQLAQLAAERRTIVQAQRELSEAQAAVGTAGSGWFLSIAITTP